MSSYLYFLLGLLVVIVWVLYIFRKTFFSRKSENIPDSDAKSAEDLENQKGKEVSD